MTNETRRTIEKYADLFKTESLLGNNVKIANDCDSDYAKEVCGAEILYAVIELGKEALADELFNISLAKLAGRVMGED